MTAYGAADREVVYRVLAERRDIRRGFTGTPIADEVLLRVLAAAHRAPSVGLSQPWDFLLIRDLATRRRVLDLALGQRKAFADSLPPARRRAFDPLKVEAILDTPLNIAVTCDPERGGRHVLGRHADPRTPFFSTAIAVQNLWLAARAEGLGVGWVSFFDPAELGKMLGLPPHVEVVGYLCVGHVTAFPDTPELVTSGWAARRPLSWAVHRERWGRRDASIVDDAGSAAPNGPATGETIRLFITETEQPRATDPDCLTVHVGNDRPPPGVLWRSARSLDEAVEHGVELIRDLSLQGIGLIHSTLIDDTETSRALAKGIELGARATGVRHLTSVTP